MRSFKLFQVTDVEKQRRINRFAFKDDVKVETDSTKFLNKIRVFLEYFWGYFSPLKCNRKPVKWKFHLFHEFLRLCERAWKFISFSSIFFRLQANFLYLPSGLFSFISFRIFHFPFGLKLTQPKKVLRFFNDFYALLFSHVLSDLAAWRKNSIPCWNFWSLTKKEMEQVEWNDQHT